MSDLERITSEPDTLDGRPCIRGLPISVGAVLALVAAGYDHGQILRAHPELEEEDIRAALEYAETHSFL